MAKIILGPMLKNALERIPNSTKNWENILKAIKNRQSTEIEILLSEIYGPFAEIKINLSDSWISNYPNYIMLARVGQLWIIEHGSSENETVDHHIHVGMLPEATLPIIRNNPLSEVMTIGPVTAEIWPENVQIKRAGNLFKRNIMVDQLRPGAVLRGKHERKEYEHWLMIDVTEKSSTFYV